MTQNIIGVAGEIASGTTTFAEHAQDNYGAHTHRFSIPLQDLLAIIFADKDPAPRALARLYLTNSDNVRQRFRSMLAEAHFPPEDERRNDQRFLLQELSTILRARYGENVIGRAVVEDIARRHETLVVIEGIRRRADIAQLSAFPNFVFVYVEADFDARFARYRMRGRFAEDATLTREAFAEICGRESEQQIRELQAEAHHVINNSDNDMATYRAGIDAIIRTHFPDLSGNAPPERFVPRDT